jgi:HNH endonuclease
MGRIRTVKPEFWEDEKVGMLSREARLLFIATFNLADDEGLLRWTPAYIKASVFMYDNDLDTKKIRGFMEELMQSDLLFAYAGGVSHQPLAIIVNFHKHQRINRPQPGKLPAPSLQNCEVRTMYARRDGWLCALCGLPIPGSNTDDAVNLSIDHIVHESKGGTDYPSNVRATHQNCNNPRGDESFRAPGYIKSRKQTLTDSRKNSTTDSVNDSPPPVVGDPYGSVNRSLPEGKGREQGAGKGKEQSLPESAKNADSSSGQTPDKFADFEFESPEADRLFRPTAPDERAIGIPALKAAIQEVFTYYVERTHRSPKLYTLTDIRRKKAMARLEEALRIAHGDLAGAVELMKAAVDEIALSDWHMGRDPKTAGKSYCEWEDHLFRSTEQFEKWLQKAQDATQREAAHG